jgi:glycosyltransferase involved in cell wall biosynthesis
MLFSVIIPTFNRASFLSAAIRSVLSQDCTDFEIIVCDDGSTDDTAHIASSLTSAFPAKIKYLHQENKERAAARNIGIRASQGQYVVLLDSDDIMLPLHLSTLQKAIRQHPAIDFFTTGYMFKQGEEIKPSSVTSMRMREYNYSLLLKGNPFACNVCFRTKQSGLHLFVENREFSTMEDWMFLFQNLRDRSILLIPEVTILMGDHEGRSMNQHSLIIQRRDRAMEWIIANCPLTKSETCTLKSGSYYFCAIHSYLNSDNSRARHFLKLASEQSGFNQKILLLYLKMVIGKKLVSFISKVIR